MNAPLKAKSYSRINVRLGYFNFLHSSNKNLTKAYDKYDWDQKVDEIKSR